MVDNYEENFGNNIVSVVDENGVEHTFEELDRIETDDGRYIALLPIYNEAEEILDGDGELIILSVVEDEDGETYLEPIEDEALFNEIGEIFEERLADYFEFDEE
ncbi:MAG: DUF1292 domain-containing protein [Acutalibacteraceae bacterium]|nr:DUF1292 domain-containing protein [Acutalibacteraceae bacterium]